MGISIAIKQPIYICNEQKQITKAAGVKVQQFSNIIFGRYKIYQVSRIVYSLCAHSIYLQIFHIANIY